MGRNLVIGDIHGMYDRLISVLSDADFDPKKDTLYSVGDLCDRGSEPIRTLEYLMSLPRFLPVVGNHDMWLYEYLCGHGPAPIWLDPRNGGKVTYEAFKDADSEVKSKVRRWYGSFPLLRTIGDNIILHAGPPYWVDDGDSLIRLTEGMTLASAYETKRLSGSYLSIVHGIVWDRDYIRSAIAWEKFSGTTESEDLFRKPFDTDKTIICGHTPLKEVFHSDRYHITCIDTGSFVSEGHITVMDLDTGKFFRSTD